MLRIQTSHASRNVIGWVLWPTHVENSQTMVSSWLAHATAHVFGCIVGVCKNGVLKGSPTNPLSDDTRRIQSIGDRTTLGGPPGQGVDAGPSSSDARVFLALLTACRRWFAFVWGRTH